MSIQNKKIKILFFIPTLSIGGAEKVLRNLVNNMDRSKFDITVQTIEYENPADYLNDGISYKYISKSRTSVGRKINNYLFRLCTQLKLTYPLFVKDDYDIEVAYLETSPTKVLAASTNSKAVKLAWVHCDISNNEVLIESVEKTKPNYEKFDKIVCVSNDVKKGFDRLYNLPDKTTVLYNVIDEDEIYSKVNEYSIKTENKDVINLVAVGRLSKQKNFKKLIEICSKLKKDGKNIHLRILGTGPEKENLENLINKYDLSNEVELMGFIDNPYPYINASDYVVCSSVFEGFSTVMIEAVLLGKIVITTPCSGTKEIFGNSEYGIIADDTDNGLYESIKQILNSPELQKHYLQQVNKRKEYFRKNEILKKTEEFFVNEIKSKE